MSTNGKKYEDIQEMLHVRSGLIYGTLQTPGVIKGIHERLYR